MPVSSTKLPSSVRLPEPDAGGFRGVAGEDQQRPSFRLPGGVAAGVKSGVHRNPVRVAAAAPAAARQRLVIAGNLVGGSLWAGVNDLVSGRMPLMSRVPGGQLPAMNRCHLLSVLVDEPAGDHRASPDMLNRTVATMTESP